MARKSTRTGIVLLIVFALGAAAWTYLTPGRGDIAGASMIGGGQRGGGQAPTRTGGDGRGFKGSDEELAVTGDR